MNIFKKIQVEQEAGKTQVTIDMTDRLVESLHAQDQETLEREFKERVMMMLAGNIAFLMQDDVMKILEKTDFKQLVANSVLEKLRTDNTFTSDVAKSIAERIKWNSELQEKIIEKIEWNQLTPVLTALATRELADKIFNNGLSSRRGSY